MELKIQKRLLSIGIATLMVLYYFIFFLVPSVSNNIQNKLIENYYISNDIVSVDGKLYQFIRDETSEEEYNSIISFVISNLETKTGAEYDILDTIYFKDSVMLVMLNTSTLYKSIYLGIDRGDNNIETIELYDSAKSSNDDSLIETQVGVGMQNLRYFENNYSIILNSTTTNPDDDKNKKYVDCTELDFAYSLLLDTISLISNTDTNITTYTDKAKVDIIDSIRDYISREGLISISTESTPNSIPNTTESSNLSETSAEQYISIPIHLKGMWIGRGNINYTYSPSTHIAEGLENKVIIDINIGDRDCLIMLTLGDTLKVEDVAILN